MNVWFSHNSGFILCIASLKQAKTSWYNCLPFDLVLQIHRNNAFAIKKNTRQTTLWSLTNPPVFFLVEDTLSSATAKIVSCLQHPSHTPMSHDALKKVSMTACNGKYFLTDLNTVLFLIVSLQIGHQFCTDVKHLKLFSQNFMARHYADAHFDSNFSDS